MKRHTKIICTLGPETRRPEVVQGMIEAGMDYARLNFSHGEAGEHRESTYMVREVARLVGREVKIMQDLEGSKIRIGVLRLPLYLRSGGTVALTYTPTKPGDIPVTNLQILKSIQVRDRIFLDDGAVELEAVEANAGEILCVVRIGGRVDSRSGMQVLNRDLDLPAVSEKDLADIKLGQEIEVDVVAQSMVRNRKDIEQLKGVLGDSIPIIAKIENAKALCDLEGIADRVWGLMVARGDLGVSIPRARVPLWQKEILTLCRSRNRRGIVATEMLLSMVKNDRPTRAEVSDVATAVLDGADAVMLSEETAIGAHPVEVVREMREIIETVEASKWYQPPTLASSV